MAFKLFEANRSTREAHNKLKAIIEAHFCRQRRGNDSGVGLENR